MLAAFGFAVALALVVRIGRRGPLAQVFAWAWGLATKRTLLPGTELDDSGTVEVEAGAMGIGTALESPGSPNGHEVGKQALEYKEPQERADEKQALEYMEPQEPADEASDVREVQHSAVHSHVGSSPTADKTAAGDVFSRVDELAGRAARLRLGPLDALDY